MIQKLYFEEYGNKNGQPIIFINGWGTDMTGLKIHCLKYFVNEYRCIFIDALGCGKSPYYEKSSSQYICQQTADSIVELIKDLNLYDVILYGNCVGGWLATLAALNEPSRISKLIFIDGYLYFHLEYIPFVLPVIGYYLYKFFFQTYWGLSLSNFFVGYTTKVSESLVKEQKHINAKVAVDYITDMYLMEKKGYREIIKRLEVKSLFIVGEYTLPVIKESQAYWFKNIPTSKISTVINSSHLSVSDNPKDLNHEILKYLNS